MGMAGLELHEAAAVGDYDTLTHHLRSGKYDVNQRDVEWGNRTPMHWVAWKGFIECMRLLIDYGANPNARMNGGWTPSHCAAEAGRLNFLRAMHTMNISIIKKDKYGDLPRDVARVYGHTELVKYLEQAEIEERERRRKLGKEEESEEEEIEPPDELS